MHVRFQFPFSAAFGAGGVSDAFAIGTRQVAESGAMQAAARMQMADAVVVETVVLAKWTACLKVQYLMIQCFIIKGEEIAYPSSADAMNARLDSSSGAALANFNRSRARNIEFLTPRSC